MRRLSVAVGLASALACGSTPARAGQEGVTLITPITPIAPGNWVTDDDYPAEALRLGLSGGVTFLLNVGADGVPTGCRIVESSRSEILDRATCRLLLERARFNPARDPSGRGRAATFQSRFTWRIPESREPQIVGLRIVRETRGYRCTFELEGKTRTLKPPICTRIAESLAKQAREVEGVVPLGLPEVVAAIADSISE
ncbi:energy transducer TonB [Sphingomonas sp.]|uniref:energy transducer TonB n=1 Tax=Sphingomonas sp. TaxID=28214 RepID=UPI001EB2EFCA|nr:energy transducer TonB [Sphingomonas sp.]MBX3594560.1 energy transducer TonB [Sphingomonas sp.]